MVMILANYKAQLVERASRLPNGDHVEAYMWAGRIPASRWPPPSAVHAWHFLLSMAATEGPIPTAEEKIRIMMAKKELIQALMKRRALDKQLVRYIMFVYFF
jgi:hypothetical protein